MTQGFFITFEGGEGAGKTTLITQIAHELTQSGYTVIRAREPGGTELGEQIREILLHKPGNLSPHSELCLFLASRAQHIAEVIGPALKKNYIVLCDRFNDSSIAYQGAARGLGMEKVSEFCTFISQGLEPNLTFYLDVSPESGLMRALKDRPQDRIEAEALSFHQKIREAYQLLHAKYPKRLQLLDASKPSADVYADALKFIYLLLKKRHV